MGPTPISSSQHLSPRRSESVHDIRQPISKWRRLVVCRSAVSRNSSVGRGPGAANGRRCVGRISPFSWRRINNDKKFAGCVLFARKFQFGKDVCYTLACIVSCHPISTLYLYPTRRSYEAPTAYLQYINFVIDTATRRARRRPAKWPCRSFPAIEGSR